VTKTCKKINAFPTFLIDSFAKTKVNETPKIKNVSQFTPF